MAQMMGMMGGAGGMSSMGGSLANIFASAAAYKLAKEEAELLADIGRLEGGERRRLTSKLIGAQRAAYLKGGVELSGTPLDVMAETAATEELDALRLEWEYKMGARTKRLQGIQGLISSIFQGGSTAGQTILGSYGTRRGTVPTSQAISGSVNFPSSSGSSGFGMQRF